MTRSTSEREHGRELDEHLGRHGDPDSAKTTYCGGPRRDMAAYAGTTTAVGLGEDTDMLVGVVRDWYIVEPCRARVARKRSGWMHRHGRLHPVQW